MEQSLKEDSQNSLKFIYDRLVEHESILNLSYSKLDGLLHPQTDNDMTADATPSIVTLDMICSKVHSIGRTASEINKTTDLIIGN